MAGGIRDGRGRILENTDPLFTEIAENYPHNNYTSFCNEFEVRFNSAEQIRIQNMGNLTAALKQVLNKWLSKGKDVTREKLETALTNAQTGGLVSIVKKNFAKYAVEEESYEDFSCAVRARQSSLIQQNNRHTLDHPAKSHPQQAKLTNPQHGPLFPEASSSSQPYPLQPPPVRQRTVLPQNLQVALSAAGLYQQQQQQQEYFQQAPSTSVRHQAHNMLGNEGHVMDLSSASVTSLASELSEYSDDSCSKEFTTLTTPLGPDVPTLDWVIYKMMEREKTQQLYRERIETCHLYELPIDPWKWTSMEVTKWATWFMRKTNPTTAQDVTTTFENSPITGESLAHFSETELKQYFGEFSSQAHECLRLWLEGMSPRGYDIQRRLLNLERSKQTMLEQLIDVMVVETLNRVP